LLTPLPPASRSTHVALFGHGKGEDNLYQRSGGGGDGGEGQAREKARHNAGKDVRLSEQPRERSGVLIAERILLRRIGHTGSTG